jgi:hypothetical protein
MHHPWDPGKPHFELPVTWSGRRGAAWVSGASYSVVVVVLVVVVVVVVAAAAAASPTSGFGLDLWRSCEPQAS